jgi:hypothetical protein
MIFIHLDVMLLYVFVTRALGRLRGLSAYGVLNFWLRIDFMFEQLLSFRIQALYFFVMKRESRNTPLSRGNS